MSGVSRSVVDRRVAFGSLCMVLLLRACVISQLAIVHKMRKHVCADALQRELFAAHVLVPIFVGISAFVADPAARSFTCSSFVCNFTLCEQCQSRKRHDDWIIAWQHIHTFDRFVASDLAQ